MKSILLVKKLLGLVEMKSGLVNASFSLPERQAVKMIFFAPWGVKLNYSLRVVARDIISWLLFLTSLIPSRPRQFWIWCHLSSLSGKFAQDASRYRARFQASSGHSDSVNRPGYEADFSRVLNRYHSGNHETEHKITLNGHYTCATSASPNPALEMKKRKSSKGRKSIFLANHKQFNFFLTSVAWN